MANIPCLKKERKRKAVKYNVVTITLLERSYPLRSRITCTKIKKNIVKTYSPSKGFPFSKGKIEVHRLDKFLTRYNKILC